MSKAKKILIVDYQIKILILLNKGDGKWHKHLKRKF
jgi:hypothetical protein